MANYQNLKAAISAAIRTNGNQEITGQVLQDVLNSIVSVIGANYTFAGVATPATNPVTPDQNVMYLAMEGGTYTNFNGTVLPAGISLLMWNGTWKSETVMSGDGGVFDISVYKSSGGTLATFADLAAALDGGNNIPASARKGGMSVKFVCSSDNKYVQYRLMANSFTTDVTQWQGVDDEPTAGSGNLVKSGGVVFDNIDKSYVIPFSKMPMFNGWPADGGYVTGSARGHKVLCVNGGEKLTVKRGTDNSICQFFKTYDGVTYDYATGETAGHGIWAVEQTFTLPADTKYVVIGVLFGNDRTPSVIKLDGYDVMKGFPSTINDCVSFNRSQTTTLEQQEQAQQNIGISGYDNEPTIGSGKLVKSGGIINLSWESLRKFSDVFTNLYNPATSKDGYDINHGSGNETLNSVYTASDYIAVSPGDNLYLSFCKEYAYYKKDKTYLSGQTSTNEPFVGTVPDNAYYVRLTVRLDDKYSFIAALSSVPVPYVPYGVIVNKEENEISMPKNIYLLDAVNNDIFFAPIVKKWNPYRYNIHPVGSIEESLYRRLLPTVMTFGNTSLTELSLAVYDNEKDADISSVTCSIKKGVSGQSSSAIKIGLIGDSYTTGEFYTNALLAHNYVPNLQMVGTREADNYNGQFTDGRAGWSLVSFFTPQTGTDRFNPFLHPQGTHRCWGVTGFWTGALGENPNAFQRGYAHYASLFNASTGYPISPVDGDVIYDSTASSWKEFDGSSWNTVSNNYIWVFDYPKYASLWNIAVPDMLFIELGVNDFWVNANPTESNLSTWKDRADAIISSYHSSNANGKVVFLCPNTVTMPMCQKYNPLKVHHNMWTFRKFLIDTYDNREAEKIYVVDTAHLVDLEHGYTIDTTAWFIKPFDGYVGNETIRATMDGQHPRPNFTTLGYSMAAFIQYHR